MSSANPARYDFSVCLNAYGASDIVREAIRSAAFDEYPDPHATVPRLAAAARWDRPITELLFAAGAAELIHLVCFAYLRPGDSVAIVTPAFGEYERATRLCGAQPFSVDSRSADGEDLDIVIPLCDAIRRQHPRLGFLCTPMNPTGRRLSRDAVTAIADVCAAEGTLLVVDQAYEAFVDTPDGTPMLPGHPAVLHLRSITKDHALAGVRAAFAVAPANVIGALAAVQLPWSTSAAAQSAGTAAMTDAAQAYVRRSTATLRADTGYLIEAISGLGYPVRPSSTHFFVIDVGHATACRDTFLGDRQLLVRDCTSFGLPALIRVAARTPDDNRALVDALTWWSTSRAASSVLPSSFSYV